jgi:hypothetical protein
LDPRLRGWLACGSADAPPPPPPHPPLCLTTLRYADSGAQVYYLRRVEVFCCEFTFVNKTSSQWGKLTR